MQSYLLFGILVLVALSLVLNLYLLRKVQWVFRRSNQLKRAMDRKFRQQFRQMQCLQALHEDLALPARLPPTGGKAASADFLKLLADLVREDKPAVVVECGSGLSTVVIARCLQLNGRGQVFSLEHMEKFAAQTRKELDRRGLSEWACVLDAPLERRDCDGREYHWYRAAVLPDLPIDLLIVDGPPARTGVGPRYPAGPVLFPRLSPGGAVLVDDAGRPEELAVIERWRQAFPALGFKRNIEDYEKGVCVVRAAAAQRRLHEDTSADAPADAALGSVRSLR